MILRLLGRGHSIHTAVGEIERVYGEGKTVSTYINLLWQDRRVVTEFRQPLQVQSHLEVPRILVQLGHIQRT